MGKWQYRCEGLLRRLFVSSCAAFGSGLKMPASARAPERRTLGLTTGLLVLAASGFMSIVPSVVAGQESDSGVDLDPSQSWAMNWFQNRQQRVMNRQRRIDRLLSWNLSDTTTATIYGQLNVLYQVYDDGIDPFTSFANNPNSPGRLGVNIESDLQGGAGLTVTFETGLKRSDYDGLLNRGGASNSSSDWNLTLLRKAEIRLFLPEVGFVSFGQGNMAGDGITGFDFSKTGNVATNSVSDSASGTPTYFVDGTATGSALQSFFPTFDASRRFRVRFDSVSREGLSWSASAGREVLVEGNSNTYVDAALRYETRWHRFRIKGGVAYAYNDASPDFLSGSIAGKDDETGLNFAVAGGTNLQDARYGYLKLGLIRRVIRAGDTAVSLDYYAGHEPQALAYASSSMGIAVTQDWEAANLQVFATYRRYDVSGAVKGIQGSDLFAAGVRVTW